MSNRNIRWLDPPEGAAVIDVSDASNWQRYRRIITTPALRMLHPFVVETPEGELTCRDGWLAVDVNGDFYPISDDVFRKTYEEIPS